MKHPRFKLLQISIYMLYVHVFRLIVMRSEDVLVLLLSLLVCGANGFGGVPSPNSRYSNWCDLLCFACFCVICMDVFVCMCVRLLLHTSPRDKKKEHVIYRYIFHTLNTWGLVLVTFKYVVFLLLSVSELIVIDLHILFVIRVGCLVLGCCFFAITYRM